MLKKDKNAFLDVIQENGLDSLLFRHYEKDVDNQPAFILRLENTSLFFMARIKVDDFHSFDCQYIKFAPNFPKSDFYPKGIYDNWMNIGSLLSHFEAWLEQHVKVYLSEIDTPDLWDQLKDSSIAQFKFEDPQSQKQFNKLEKEQIRTALEKFKIELLSTYNQSDREATEISKKIDYLSRKLDELNRFDWQSVAISTVIGISITLSLDTEKGKILFSMFKKAGVDHKMGQS